MGLLHVEDPMDWRTRSGHGTARHAHEVRPERVPELIDALDCLLALWVAEATLDCEASTRSSRVRRRPGV